MILMIDNYDSFTWNLVQYLQILNQEVCVYHHDKINIDDINALKPHKILISPGPGRPDDAGISMDVIRRFSGIIPILGICLGHQCIAQVYGAKIIESPEIVHGKTSIITHNYQRLFSDVSQSYKATRYHSLAVECDSLPNEFHIDAWADNTIMAISHRQMPLFGLQFHPEAILTEHGIKLLKNFINHELTL